MTGRGYGGCVLPVEALPVGDGRGYGRGFGWGRGHGAGLGRGRGFAGPLLPVDPAEPAADPTLARLKRLEERLAALEAQLSTPPPAQA
jgi:hypothetical protein